MAADALRRRRRGIGFVDVDYLPQSVELVQDDDNVFAYQLIGGASYAVSEKIDLFAQGRYRATDDVRIRGAASGPGIPLALELDVENEGFVIDGGVRFKF
jgi:opacity protein-like surface antigen